MAFLRLMTPSELQDEIQIRQRVVTIGSAEDNSVRIDHPSIAPVHISLIDEGGSYLLIDHSSKEGTFVDDGKQLLNDYITTEELWACTTCNACVEECPVSISPLSIILDMRRYLVMEQSAAPAELNNMMTNIENNGAPWPYNQMDRLNWKDE